MLLAAFAMLLIGLTLGIWAASLVLRVLDEHLAALGRRWFPSLKPQRPVGFDSASAPTAVRPWQRWFAVMIGTIAMLASPVILRQAYLFGTEDALGNARGSLWDWWMLGVGLCSTMAFASLLLALRFDPPRGRRRCGKCWYDYTGLADTAACPECGRVLKNAADLRRTRGHRGMGWLAVLLLVAALGLWRTPAIIAGGPLGGVPTTVLILGMGVLPAEWNARTGGTPAPIGQSLGDRFERGEPWRWQESLVGWRARSLLYSSNDAHRKFALYCTMNLTSTLRDEDAAELLRLAAQLATSASATDRSFGYRLVNGIVGELGRTIRLSAKDRAQWLMIAQHPTYSRDSYAMELLMAQKEVPDEDIWIVLREDRRRNWGSAPRAVATVAKASPKIRAALENAVQHGDQTDAEMAMRTLVELSNIETPNGDWFAEWTGSDRPFVVLTALDLAIDLRHYLSPAMLGRTESFASVEGPLQLTALRLLAARAEMKPREQRICVEIMKGPNADRRRHVARSLLIVSRLLAADVVDELRHLCVAAGKAPPFSESGEASIEEYLLPLADKP